MRSLRSATIEDMTNNPFESPQTKSTASDPKVAGPPFLSHGVGKLLLNVLAIPVALIAVIVALFIILYIGDVFRGSTNPAAPYVALFLVGVVFITLGAGFVWLRRQLLR